MHWQSVLNGDLPRGPRWVLVACIDDQIVAYAGLTPSRDANVSRVDAGEIGALYVHPEWWRHGVGRTLLNASLDFLAKKGYSIATLWTLEENSAARSFYEAEGWSGDGGRQELELDLPGVNLTEVRYRKMIST